MITHEVRRKAGVPVIGDFANSQGTPIVVNTTTGQAYVLNDSNIVVELGLSSTPGTVNSTGQMAESVRTEVIETTGLTRTLPQANTSRIGQEWTVLLNVVGNVTISPDTGDSIILPTTDTTVALYNKGDSLTFRCLSATQWGMV